MCASRMGAFKQTTRKSHSISGERVRLGGLQAILLESVVQIGLGGVIALRGERFCCKVLPETKLP